MKGKLLQEVCDTFSEEENVQIKERAQELRQQYLTLQDLRKAHDLTQERILDEQAIERITALPDVQ